MIVLLSLLACGSSSSDGFSDVLLARRISLDLRGLPPTEAELNAVEEDPEQVWALRDAWLEAPELEERLVWLFAERWGTRVETFNVEMTDYQRDAPGALTLARAVGEEPLRLMARIAVEDRPFHEIVTTGETLADETLAEIWPLVRESGAGWQPATYTDGRPAAGVLTTNGLWWRYTTTYANLNRGRANTAMRLLMCADMLTRPVSFSGVAGLLADEALTLTAQECVACHSTLDPLAATLFGFWWAIRLNASEMERYHPEREMLGEPSLGVSAAWFGTPVGSLQDVGVQMAEDVRFARCAAEQVASALWRRPVALEDFEEITGLVETYQDEGERLLPVISAALETSAYVDPAPRLLAPDQLSSLHAALTGFRWTYLGHDQLDNDTWGYKVLAGGVDGELVTAIGTEPACRGRW